MKTTSIISFLALFATLPMALAAPEPQSTDSTDATKKCERIIGHKCDGKPERACNCAKTDIITCRKGEWALATPCGKDETCKRNDQGVVYCAKK
ncbi:MAG: hypothetical protein M1812_006107 [Candelaria pacifica]|nr:MAG: hypothetical protein M1812_006107 [Candelaria pacifica]